MTPDLTRINASALSEAQQFGQFNFWETDPYMMLLDENPLNFFPRPQDGFFDDLTTVRIALDSSLETFLHHFEGVRRTHILFHGKGLC